MFTLIPMKIAIPSRIPPCQVFFLPFEYEVGIKAEDVHDILESKNRISCYDTAPASGLFLVKVFYDEKSVNDFKLEKPPFWT